MRTDSRLRARWNVAALGLGLLAVSGCAGLRLYDQSKDTAAKGIKTEYGQVALVGVVDVERKNLDALLQEELTVLREARRANLDHDLLGLIDSDYPIGYAIAETIETHVLRMKDKKPTWEKTTVRGALVTRATDLAGPPGGMANLRRADLDAERLKSFAGRVRDRADSIAELSGGQRPPPCHTKNFDTALDDFFKAIAKPIAEVNKDPYQKACQELMTRQVGAGAIERAAAAAHAARIEVDKRSQAAQAIGQQLRKATEQHDRAAEAVKAADTSQTRQQLEEAAKTLKDALDGAAKAADAAGVEALTKTRLEAIDRILAAVAAGQVNAEALKDPGLAQATRVAAAVPSLVGTIETMRQKAKVPSVSDLLIEKEHQLLLRDHALRRVAFAEERVVLLDARYRALALQGDLVREEHDAVCQFLERQAKLDKRVDCDSLTVAVKQPPEALLPTLDKCSYKIGRTAAGTGDPQALTGAACPLAMTWRDALDKAEPEARRHLYGAVSAMVRRRGIAEVLLDEADIKLVDLAHREVLTHDEFAIHAWNSLIATPINQLAAYYETGIKPAELADIIVKAVGLGAIAIGVNR